jgi:arylsulfatase A-like enzyme
MKENTLVIFAADNGLAVGQHGLMGKQNIYEHSVKVPMIISGPGIPVGKATDAFVFLNDIFPTIANYTHLEMPSTVEGISFEKLFSNPESVHREVIPVGYKNYQRGIRKDNWKLLEYHVNGERNTQLFNLEEDPYETHNLAEFPAQESKVKELRKELILKKNLLNDTSKFWIGIDFQ